MTRSHRLLPLEGNADRLPLLSHRHARGSFLRTDRTGLALVLDKGNPLATRHQTHLLEALEAAKHGREALLVGGVGQVTQEENLVGREILVGDDSRGGTAGGLETGAFGGFGGASSVGGARGSLELLLGFKSFVGLFALWFELAPVYLPLPPASNVFPPSQIE